MDATLLSKIPESIMKHHDPNDDPFAGLADDSNQLISPLEYGSGISFLVQQQEDREQEQVQSSSPSSSSPPPTDKEEEKEKDVITTDTESPVAVVVDEDSSSASSGVGQEEAVSTEE